MIPNLLQSHKRLLIVIVVLVIVDVAALAMLYSPMVKSGTHARQEIAALRAELKAKRVQAIPALDMDKKLAEARTQIAEFYSQNFPNRYSEISQNLAKAANESGVQLLGVRYASKATVAAPGLSEVDLSLDVSGDYEAEIRFINALERSKMFLVIGNVDLTEGQAGALRLSVGVETFLRTAQS